MEKVSVIIPARTERYLQQTIDDLFTKAKGEIEIVVVLDGYWPDPILRDHANLTLIHRSDQRGMRSAVNSGVSIAHGDYILKCDGHCAFDEGFDQKLQEDCESNWTVVPVRYRLNADTWERGDKRPEFQYIERGTLKGRDWREYEQRVAGLEIVDLMTSQGSFWFMKREWFEKIGGEDDINYGWTGREAQEICLKTWLSGGRYVLNRKTWYAHWDKVREEVVARSSEKAKSIAYALSYWTEDKIKPVIDKFAPVPSWNGQSLTTPSTIKSRAELYQIFAQRGYKVGCEVGVEAGRNALNILNNIPDLKLYLVDPYQDYALSRKLRKGRNESAKRRMLSRVKDRNVVILEMMSEDAVKQVPDESLDFVYIDGNHSYDFAMLDIILWSRKVRKGGIVSGHDYFNDPRHNCGVQSAVDNYTKQHNIKVNLTEKVNEPPNKSFVKSWWWEK